MIFDYKVSWYVVNGFCCVVMFDLSQNGFYIDCGSQIFFKSMNIKVVISDLVIFECELVWLELFGIGFNVFIRLNQIFSLFLVSVNFDLLI